MTNPATVVLIVDDEQLNRDMLSRRLEKRGFSTLLAASGAEALELLETAAVAAVLLDVQMPGMSGIEVLRTIRARWTRSELPVLMVTARDQSDDVVSALDLGANDYITKPVDFAVTLARLKTHLALRETEARLRASEERYALAARGGNDGLWDWDLLTNTVHYSDRWKEIVGCGDAEIGASPDDWFARVHAEDLPGLRRDLDAHLRGQTPHFENEHRLRHASGTFRWVLARGRVARDADGAAVRLAGSQSDVTDSKVVDALTGLANRTMLGDRLAHLLGGGDSDGPGLCAVLMLDLDDFKLVNEGLNQRLGDQLLQAVARRLESALRATDGIVRPGALAADAQTVARLGGDEFVILLPEVRDAGAAIRVAERVQRVLARPFVIEHHEVFVSASVGIALGGRHADTAADLLRDADTAMAHAKSVGKGRIELFDVQMREKVVERLRLDTALRLAMERNEFLPHYQPIVELATGRLVGFEALIRWRQPDGRLVPPGVFVPIIEANGLLLPIGRKFTEAVCRQLRDWRAAFPGGAPVWVNVNFASSQFADPGVLDGLLEALAEAGLSPADLVIEITESAALGNFDQAAETLRRFRDAGLRVVLDDFGTGFSSLSCLHELPLSGIKLDRSFIADERRHPAILRAIVMLAGQLGLTVTAEGIETPAHHAHLRELGCGYAQGYLFARPLDAAAAGALIRDHAHWPLTMADNPAA